MSLRAPAATGRIAVVDVLRGSAMFGILSVNIWFFASASINAGVPDPDYRTWDAVAYGAATLLFATKSYVLFSFLFGYSFVLQESGPGFERRMRRRLLALAVIGLVHAVLLYPGDILVLYGLLGFVLLAMRGLPWQRALRRAVVLTGVAGTLLLAAGLLLWWAGGSVAPDGGGLAADLEQAYTAGPAGVVGANVAGYPATIAFVALLQALPALAAMLCGMAAARCDLFRDPAALRAVWRRLAGWAPAVGVLGAVAFTWLSGIGAAGPLLVGFGATVLTAPLLTATYVALLVAWHRRAPGSRVLAGIAATGRLALTNYLFQSLAMAWLFTGYGLALMERLGAAQVWIVIVAIYALQVLASSAWVRRHRYGPAEWVLRRWTLAGARP